MKRDMELIRKILFQLEETQNLDYQYEFEVDGYDYTTVFYHLLLLHDAGFIDAIVTKPRSPYARRIEPVRLTWQGAEFLEAMRSDTVWADVNNRMAAVGGFVTEVALALAIKLISRQAGL